MFNTYRHKKYFFHFLIFGKWFSPYSVTSFGKMVIKKVDN